MKIIIIIFIKDEQYSNAQIPIECILYRKITTLSKWMERVSYEMNKLQKILKQSPVIQGIDPIVLNIFNHSFNTPPPNPSDIKKRIDKFNDISPKDPIFRNTVYQIIRNHQSDFPIPKENEAIEFNNLDEKTQREIELYISLSSTLKE